MTEMNLMEAVRAALMQTMEDDPAVVVLGEDVGLNGGVFRATDGLQRIFGKDRVIDTPLSESGIIGTSIGMAMNGLKPVPEIQFSGFIYPALDQLASHASRIRTRTRGQRTCPITLRTPSGGGIRALEHHSESEEGILCQIPGLKVVMPSNPYDAKGLLIASIRDPNPVIFMEPKRIYRAAKGDVPSKSYEVPIGKAKVVQQGNELTIISWGASIYEAMQAANSSGFGAEIIDLRTISPLDIDAIIESVAKTGRALIVHEAPKNFSVGGEIAALINEKALTSLQAPVMRVCGFNTVFPLAKLEKYSLPSVARIQQGINKVMSY